MGVTPNPYTMFPPAGGGGSVTNPVSLLNDKSGRSVGTGTYTTAASGTPTVGGLLIATVATCTNGGASHADITLTDSLGHTWTALTMFSRVGSGSDYIGLRCFIAPNSAASTFTVTVDAGATDIYSYNVMVSEVTGQHATPLGSADGNVSSTGNGAVSITLDAAPAVGSQVFAALCTYETNDATLQITPGAAAPWIERAEAGRSVPNSQTQYRTGSTSTAVNWDDNGTSVTGYLGCAFEIVAA